MTAPAGGADGSSSRTVGEVPGRVDGIEFTAYGTGTPVTVFAHGLGGSTAETGTLAARVPGTRVLFHFRGHGGSDPLAGRWDYDLLADDLLRVADRVGATCAVGLSLGAGALLRVLRRDPTRFDRLVFAMPAALDEARDDDSSTRHLHRLAAAMRTGDEEGVITVLLEEVPAAVRPSRVTHRLMARRARDLAGRVPPYPRTGERPLDDTGVLDEVVAPALVLAQQDDDLHPLVVARRLAAALPAATYRELPPGGTFWTARADAQRTIADHLAG